MKQGEICREGMGIVDVLENEKIGERDVLRLKLDEKASSAPPTLINSGVYWPENRVSHPLEPTEIIDTEPLIG